MKKIKTEIKDLFTYQISPANWAKRHNLKIEKKNCSECGKKGFIDIPCYSNGYVGFYKDGCKCGSDLMSFNFKPYSEPKKELFDNLEIDPKLLDPFDIGFDPTY